MSLLQTLKNRIFKDKDESNSNDLNEKNEIIKAVKEVSQSLDKTYELFNMTDDENLIESYIHKINSLNAQYDYLIKEAKKQGCEIEKQNIS